MKKIFTLAIALIAITGAASAQDRVMVVTTKDKAQETINVADIKQITFLEDKWNEYAVGDYYYGVDLFDASQDLDSDVFSTYDGYESVGKDLVLYRNNADPNLWKIADWSPGKVDFTFYYYENQDEPNVFVGGIDTGLVSEAYGGICVTDYWNYWGYGDSELGAWSVYDKDNQAFIFSLVYFSPIGAGIYAEGKETFLITKFLNADN